MATLEKKVFAGTVGKCSFFLDTRYYPLLISGFSGVPTIELLDAFYLVRDPVMYASKELEAKLINVVDMTRMDVPNPVVRKYLAEKGGALDIQLQVLDTYVTIIPSAVMRGVVTALNWVMSDKGARTVTASDVDTAIKLASKRFQELEVEFPRPEGIYEFPYPS